jgi:hypothetical protein
MTSRLCPECGYYSSFGYGFLSGVLCGYEACDDDCGWFVILVTE